jgi:hypothetical protein
VGLIIALLWIVTRFGTPGFETGAGVAGVVGILAAIGAILGAITSRGRGAP